MGIDLHDSQDSLAFSLVELSIVLVILGLLVGGILAGKSLIRASELRSVVTQFQAFHTAHNSFKDKYMALAGDMANATQFWGLAGGLAAPNNPNCIRALCSSNPATATCNSDGNGFLDLNIIAIPCASSERARYWKHLSNAGLIAGKFSQTNGTDGTPIWTSSDLPSGKIANSLWYPYSDEYTPFYFSLQGTAASWFASTVLTPEELWNIDTKLDDGKPAVGKVMGYGGVDCMTGFTATDTYVLTTTSAVCSAQFYTQ